MEITRIMTGTEEEMKDFLMKITLLDVSIKRMINLKWF